ncbi:CLUMA_CG013094, isoform A [Clunio marinus]|uniref:CLUMA_CG013094, isoform A n=1 Tax=Clunio marinus TaxID=568069 RepID=A0A1J1IJ43_9DIPT|nr:CLUMA_CG013094, isoform A [Clunio marinus]
MEESKIESTEATRLSPKNDSKLTKEEYFRLLQEWVNLQSAFRAMAYFPLAMTQTNQSSVPTANGGTNISQQQQPAANQQFGSGRWFDPARTEEIIRNNGGYELVISPLYKRFLAEVIDTVILFIVKILFFVVVMDFFDIHIGLDIDINDFKDMKFLEDDYTQLLSFSSDFLLLEILTKIVSSLYEALFTVRLHATPGKLIMGIRILQADAVLPLEEQINHHGFRALVFPATQLTFARALARSCAKNLLVTLLFPLYFRYIFFFKSNQLIYDLLAKTVVVNFNPNPVLRRRNQ